VIAHVGIVALGLAMVALKRLSIGAVFGALMVAGGVILALGSHTALGRAIFARPVALWEVINQPARALILVPLGVAVLAAVGLDRLDRGAPAGARPRLGRRGRWAARAAAAVGVAIVAMLLAPWARSADLPSRGVREIWVGLGIMAVDIAVLLPLLRPRRWVACVLVAVVAAELLIAGARLPFTRTSVRAAFDVGPALATAVRSEEAPPRVARIAPVAEAAVQADADVERYEVARAGRDQLAANTAMLDGVATLDGLRTTFTPTRPIAAALGIEPRRGRVVPDFDAVGVLAGDPLGLLGPRLGVTHVLGPSRAPVRAGNTEFVLGVGIEVAPGDEARIDLGQERIANGVALLTVLGDEAPGAGEQVAELSVTEAGGAVRRRTLVAGVDTGVPGGEPAGGAVSLGDGSTAFVTEQPLGRAGRFQFVTVHNLAPGSTLHIYALSLLDERTGGSLPVLLNEVLRPLSGVAPTVYKDLRTPPRATIVRGYAVSPDADATIRALSVLPLETVVLDRDPGLPGAATGAATPGIDQVRIARYEPNRVEVLATAVAPGVLVLRDTYYPGWRVRVDGEPAPLLRADGLFRAVVVPEGTHSIVFEFRPRGLQQGAAISLLTVALLLLASIAAVRWPWSRRAAGAEAPPVVPPSPGEA
jgi:hypothetical protein